MIVKEFDDLDEELDGVESEEDGNDTPDNVVEKYIKLGGHRVKAQCDELGNVISVEQPEGLDEKEQAKIQKLADNYNGALAQAQKDRLLQKRQIEAQEETNRLLREQANKPKVDDGTLSPAMKIFGTEDWVEIEDMKTTHPDRYSKGIQQYHTELAKQQAIEASGGLKAELSERNLLSQIESAGYDPKAVQVFMKQNGFNNLESAFKYYQKENPIKKNVSRSDILNDKQSRGVKVLPPGGIAPKKEEKPTPGQLQVIKLQNAGY